jgi:hypothetical protein
MPPAHEHPAKGNDTANLGFNVLKKSLSFRLKCSIIGSRKRGLSVAGELLMSISQDERERAIFRSRRIYQNDLESDRATAALNAERIGMEIGMEKGMEKGRAEERLSIARKMLRRNRPIDEIMEDTALTRAEIEVEAKALQDAN